MTNFKISGEGLVLPAGTLPPASVLPEGEIRVVIDNVQPENGYAESGEAIPSDHQMVRLAYPDGFVKNHQAADITTLLSKIAAVMRGRFGLEEVKYESVPSSLQAGEFITISRE